MSIFNKHFALFNTSHLNFNITNEESELVAQLKQKSLQAFSNLYDKYAPALYTVILQIVRDQETAVKVIQEVFLIIMFKIDTYESNKERLFTWMFKIARNAAIEAAARSKNNTETLEQPPRLKEMSHGVADLDIDNYGLKEVIMKMKAEQKTLIELCYYKGFSYNEIAKTLNIPLDTVQTKLKIALSELSNLLFKKK